MSRDRWLKTEHLVADLKGRSVRGGVVSFAGQGLKLVLHMAQITVLARLLTPGEYGVWGMAVVVTGFLALFQELGLSVATVQRRDITHDQVSALFWINVALGGGLALVAGALAPAVAWWYGEPRLVPVVAILATAFVCGGAGVQHHALLRRQMRFGRIAAVELGSLVAGTAAGIAAAWLGASYWALVAVQLATVVTSTAGAWVACDWRPSRPRRAPVRPLIRFGADLLGSNIVGYVAQSLDIFLLGRRWGGAVVGHFERANRLARMPATQINAPVTSVALPALSRVVDQPQRYREAYRRFVEKILLVSVPGIACLVVTADWIVAVVMGPQWEEAGRVFAILGAAALLTTHASTFGWLFISQARTREMMRFGVVDLVVRVIALMIGVRWGATGVAVAITARTMIAYPLWVWVAGRRGPVGMRDLLAPMTAPCVAAVAVAATVVGLRAGVSFASPWLALAVAIPLAALVAVGVLALLPSSRRALLDLRHALAQLVSRLGEESRARRSDGAPSQAPNPRESAELSPRK